MLAWPPVPIRGGERETYPQCVEDHRGDVLVGCVVGWLLAGRDWWGLRCERGLA